MVQGAIERDGGHLLIDQLLIQGVDTVFSVPGESFLPAINALFDHQKDIKLVDLTGAGDLFAAGYLHGYISQFTQRECLEKGTDLSSKVIQQFGARI